MHEIPECLNRRYQALDDLVNELSTSTQDSFIKNFNENLNPGVKLMCNFWNILKENPDCNLSEQVEQRMGLSTHCGTVSRPQHVTCYMAGKEMHYDCGRNNEKVEPVCKNKSSCRSCASPTTPVENRSCCASKSVSPSVGSDVLPLSKVLCNLKDAASFDKKCNAKINDLMATQRELQEQIQILETKEQDGVKMLKQADCMWTCMENAYKTKIAETLERQKNLLKELKEVEASTKKWRKNKKDLESQMHNINKCHQEITEKINQKTNDIKCMDIEIERFNKKIENNKKDIEACKKSSDNRKNASDVKMTKLANEITKLNKLVSDEESHKRAKEEEGKQYVKEAREDLQKICKVLLQKKLQNEDLLAEKDALIEEINLLKQTSDQCKDRCKNKEQSAVEEIKKLEKEIADYKFQCIRCHQCTDTIDVRTFCNDCPRCMEARECVYEEDHCNHDHSMDCVCMIVKQKFVDNVFENMYTMLERQAKTDSGKAVAGTVLNCLKRSRNGKLDEETRRVLQDFVLDTVKKNLNLTIVGGAVKTRCEMDTETYQQLMLCLSKVKAVRPPKEDKATAARKESCSRWGGSNECNCRKGPACVCTKKAPLPPEDPTPPEKDNAGPVMSCPDKNSTICGPDCAMNMVPTREDAETARSHQDILCQRDSCSFLKSMRAEQCVLGLESMSSFPQNYTASVSNLPNLDDMDTCQCANESMKSYTSHKDGRTAPRECIIDEVMGRYVEVSPIDKVSDT